ncbi:MAG TPA: TIR domain-containing protein [Xanthomonadales bacterium]|nr:TIR domain-containing protein [Xanthomonadales bacterium]
MADIFISYARSDRTRVETLANALQKEGLEVWWDRQILGGDDFSANIERELESAGAAVVAWSEAGSQSHWVKDEAAYAARGDKLVAISLDGTAPPMGFRQFHAIDFSGWDGKSSATEFTELIRATATRLGAHTSADLSAPGNNKATEADPIDTGPWIAVTPIKVRGDDPDMEDLAEDLTDSIASGLARFSYLNVATQSSANESKRAGATYLLGGTLRKAGSTLRLSIKLSTTSQDKQVWGERYNRAFDNETILELHDDITDHVVTAVADPYGALMRDLSAPVAMLEPEDMTPYEALLRHFIFRQRVTQEDHTVAKRAIDLATQRAPGNAELWAAMAFAELEEYKNHFNESEGALAQGLRSARRAVELDPYSAFGHFALCDASFFSRDVATTRIAGKRSLELNPRDSDAMAMIGLMTMFIGDWDHGTALVERAIGLNPNAPGWYWFGGFYNHFRLEEYEAALEFIRRVNMPQYFAYQSCKAIVLAQLGRKDEARAAVEAFESIWNDDPALYKKNINRWFYAQPDFEEKFCAGLRKAGMDLP